MDTTRIQARHRGLRLVLLALVWGGIVPWIVAAQAPRGGTRKDDAPAGAARDKGRDQADEPQPKLTKEEAQKEKEDEEEEEVESGKAKKKPPVEIYLDKAVEELQGKSFRQVQAPANLPSDAYQQIMAMARGQANVNNALIRTFVEYQASELTNRKNLQAVEKAPDPKKVPASAAAAQAISRAGRGLIDPLVVADRGGFRTAFSNQLKQTLPPLLTNHPIARTEAMMALATTGDQDLVGLFTKQISDPGQIQMVKLWAAKGLTRMALQAQRVYNRPQEVVQAAGALADLLQSDRETFWFVQARALEALGALGVSADPAEPTKAKMAVAAMQVLDHSDRPEVRAQAAWALGMMQYNAQSRANLSLLAYAVGQLASTIGEQILDDTEGRVTPLTGLLAGQVLPAFAGDPRIRNTGLTATARARNDAAAVRATGELQRLIRDVAAAAVELSRTTRTLAPQRRSDLGARVDALNAYLERNPPKDFHLVPGVPTEFARPRDQVAGNGRAR